ncbi:MAG: hypothetical protein LBP75_02085 [Planctomycetota bacterium]|jgi:hypothetical protein|nr:hypothetical protein [Planctomycetota bacterium]
MIKIIQSTIKALDGLEITIPEESEQAFNNTPYKSSARQDDDDSFCVDNCKGIKFKTKSGKIINQRMFQDDPLAVIEDDIKKIEADDIRTTELKMSFAKIMLEKGKEYDLTVGGNSVKGKYLGSHKYKGRQQEFEVGSKGIDSNSSAIEVNIDGKIFLI